MQGRLQHCFSRKPTLGTFFWQILQEQSVGFQFFIAFLNPDKVSVEFGLESGPKVADSLNQMQNPYHGKHYESVE